MNFKKKKYICISFCEISKEQKNEWRKLWDESPIKHIFNSPDFFDAYREVFGYEKYRIILCYQEGKLCGVLPLLEDRVFGIKVFAGPGRKGNYADKSAVLMRERDQKIFSAMLDKAVELGNLYLAEEDKSAILSVDSLKLERAVEWASASRWVALDKGSDVLRFMPSGQKRNLLRRIRWRRKDLEFKLFETNLEEAIESEIEIERGSYKPGRGMAFFENEKSKEFLLALLRRNPGSLRAGILYFQKSPAAVLLGFVYGATFAGYHTAFLERHRNWGAGKAVIYFMMDQLKNRGFKKVDLLRGDTDLKKQFSEKSKDQYNIYVSPDRAVILWWRLCVFCWDVLKKGKSFIDEIRFGLIPAGIARLKALPGNIKKRFGILANSIECFLRVRKNLRPRTEDMDKPLLIFSSYDGRGNTYYGGGGAIAIHEIAKRLASKFRVRVLTGKYPGCLRREFLDGVCYDRIGSCFFGPKLGHLIFHCALIFCVLTREFDIWIESFTPPFSTSFLPLFTKKPVIGLAHMLSAKDMERKYKIPFEWIENIGLKHYRYIIAISPYFQNHISALNPRARVELISNGVSQDEFQDQREYEPSYISFLGRIEVDQKGLDLLLEAYRQVADEINIPLVIAGAGSSSEMGALKKMVQKMNLEQKVLLKARVPEGEKNAFFRQSFINVIPSRFETFSLVALETLASGTPLATFDIEGLQWLPEQCRVTAPAFDPSSLGRAILRAVQDKEFRKQLAMEGEAFAKKYDWDQSAEQYAKLIFEVLKTHGL